MMFLRRPGHCAWLLIHQRIDSFVPAESTQRDTELCGHMAMKVIYNPHYNMGLMGFEKIHPFDGKKFRRAWALLERGLGSDLARYHVDVDRPLSDDELLAIHTKQHLQMMRQPSALARAFEFREVALLPYSILDLGFLTPMRWACRGSVIAARQAVQHGFAINLGGGFHHAKPERAEGFCLFSDIALIVSQLQFVFLETRRRKLPTVMLLSGGYTDASHRLIATSVAWMCESF